MCGDKEKIKVLFLCTGNSCRSQIAEGWARELKGNVIDAYSAGILPIGVSSRAKPELFTSHLATHILHPAAKKKLWQPLERYGTI